MTMFIAPNFYEYVLGSGCIFHSKTSYDMMNVYDEFSNGFSNPEYFKIRKGKYAGSIGQLGFHNIKIDDDTYLPLLI
ncbi:MAG: hypothetical protein L3J83_10305, partial [Proteobacteria bacterium]|nr:hypothetical protein [Pseudomonadota bacterium]